MEDKLYLDNIEEYVYDQDKIVTYKWLSMTLSVPFSEATRMLSEFVQQHSAPPPSKQPINLAIHVTYLVTGISRSTDDDNEKITVQLADEDELEEIKAGVDKVISVIIYSVQKGHQLKDRSSLQTAEHDILQGNLHNFSQLCAVKCVDTVDEQHGKVKDDRKTAPLLMKSEEGKELDHRIKQDVKIEKPVPQPAKELSLRGKKSKKPANPKGGIISMLTAKNVAKKSESSQSNKPAQKQEGKMTSTVKKDHSNHSEKAKTVVVSEKAKTAVVSEKTKAAVVKTSAKGNATTVTTKFDNEVFTTGDDDHVDHHHDHDQDHNDNGITKEIKEHQRSAASAAAASQVKEQKKGKNVKRRRVCQELSSEESDEDNSVATKKITKTQSESVDSTGAKKKRKIVKRLVDNMYIDEDGSMVTEKVWQDVSTDDDEEMIVATSSKPKTIPLVKAKSKQSSLSAFFHRK